MQKFLVKDVKPQLNIYASHHKMEVPLYLEKSEAQKLAILKDNHYIIQAGTIYPSNDANARGVIANDYDVTNNDLIGMMCVHGAIIEGRLTKELTTTAKEALKGMITFIYSKNNATPILIVDGDIPTYYGKAVDDSYDIEIIVSLENAEFRTGYNLDEIKNKNLITFLKSGVKEKSEQYELKAIEILKNVLVLTITIKKFATVETVSLNVTNTLLSNSSVAMDSVDIFKNGGVKS